MRLLLWILEQGCVIAPLLWLIYSHLISTELASLIGEAATKSLLNIYAGDDHASLTFDSIHGLEVGLSHIGALLAVSGRLGMTISHSKSKAILTCRGKGAESLKTEIHQTHQKWTCHAVPLCPGSY